MRRDITTGVEWKQVFFFSLPIMLGSLLQTLYNTVDGIVVGNYVSETALAAVGSSSELSLVFIAFAIGMSSGAAILISQLFGAKQFDKLHSTVSTMLILIGGLGLVITVVCEAGATWLMHDLLKVTDPEVLDLALQYFRIYAIGILLRFVYNCVSAILRAIGDSKATLYFLCVTVVANLFLDLLFVIVFRWGVAGAAAATVLTELICVVVSVIYMQKKYDVLRVTRETFRFDKGICRTCLKLGIPTTLQQCVMSFGHIFTQRLVNGFGASVMSANFIAGRIMSYLWLPCSAFNTGMSTFTAQNIGAGKLDRVKRGLRGTAILSACISVCISAICYIFAPQITKLFGAEAEALEVSVNYIHTAAIFIWIMAVYMPVTGVLQGSGDVMWSTTCTFSSFFVRIAAAYLLAYAFDFGVPSIYVCLPISWVFPAVIGYARYFSGKWKTKAVVKPRAQEETA